MIRCDSVTVRRRAGVRPDEVEPSRTRAFTLMEVTVATVIVGFVLVAALNTLARTRQGEAVMSDRGRAALLAEAMLSEIVRLPYDDPDGATLILGPEPGESGATRVGFDDVDDYNGWAAAPSLLNGTAISGYAGWTVEVAVRRVGESSFDATLLLDQGIKRVTVTIKRDSASILRADALVTRHSYSGLTLLEGIQD